MHDKNYRQDKVEVVLLKNPLTITEWNQILKNQEIVESLKKRVIELKNETREDRIDWIIEELQKILGEEK